MADFTAELPPHYASQSALVDPVSCPRSARNERNLWSSRPRRGGGVWKWPRFSPTSWHGLEHSDRLKALTSPAGSKSVNSL